jgi:hypothetical protein
MTPRPKDRVGLSAFTTPALAAPLGGKVQIIDTRRLRSLSAVVGSSKVTFRFFQMTCA